MKRHWRSWPPGAFLLGFLRKNVDLLAEKKTMRTGKMRVLGVLLYKYKCIFNGYMIQVQSEVWWDQ